MVWTPGCRPVRATPTATRDRSAARASVWIVSATETARAVRSVLATDASRGAVATSRRAVMRQRIALTPTALRRDRSVRSVAHERGYVSSLDRTHCIDYGFGNTCVDNECTSTCGPNRPCAEGICDEGSGRCVECLEDAQCGASGLICVSESCVQGCRSDEGCAVGQICTDDACVPGCRNDQGCEDGELCVDGLCARGDCRDNGDCGPGQRCVNNFCGSPCGQDSDCGVGSICVENNCQPGCRGDDDVVTCGEGAFCRDQQCIRGCPDDDACPGGQICLENSCREGAVRMDSARTVCAPHREHLLEHAARPRTASPDSAARERVPAVLHARCQRGNGRICEEGLCQDGCRDDAGCGYNARCENNQCVAGCRTTTHATEARPAGEQLRAGVLCERIRRPAGYVCNRQARLRAVSQRQRPQRSADVRS